MRRSDEGDDLAGRQALLAAGRGEAIAALAGGLAHHLNNLLATALMSLELLASETSAPAEKQLLAGAEESLRQGVALLRQLLTLASGAAGEPALFQLRSLLTDAQRMLRAVLPPGVEVVTDYPPELPLLYGDPAPVHRLLLRLGLAAGEALRGEGRLKVAARSGGARGASQVVVEVSADRASWSLPAELEGLLGALGGSAEGVSDGTWRVYLPAATGGATAPA